MIRDRYAVHSQFLDSGNTFFYFVGTVQQTILCMDVKMCKTHIPSHFLSVNIVDCPVSLYYTKNLVLGKFLFLTRESLPGRLCRKGFAFSLNSSWHCE